MKKKISTKQMNAKGHTWTLGHRQTLS